MKTYLKKFAMLLSITLVCFLAGNAQVVIKVRPGPPVIRVRPASPGPRHVWVNGNYIYRGGKYVYTDGYWSVPPPRYRNWREGHWKKRRGGWVWMPGHWR
ncbi:MAG: YXWGXW repeat-containing protein [Ferruginibacter sp.]|nr:YXWGXW repeat-containing protein [Ferruginibacter sp.]